MNSTKLCSQVLNYKTPLKMQCFFTIKLFFQFCNNVVTDFNQKLLDKLLKKLYIYNFIDMVEDNTNE